MRWKKIRKKLKKSFKLKTTEKKFEPFKWPWAVSRFHCTRCGEIREIDVETVKQLLKTMATLGNFPEVAVSKSGDWKKFYFEFPYCDCCKKTGDKEPVELKLKLIKQKHGE